MGCPTIVVGGTHSGVGKTSITLGIIAALREKGLVVQAFKVGPDFIDPLHHQEATGGRPSINLDGWMLSREQVLRSFHRATAGADIAVVEGVMGLFDGRDGHTEHGSTAEVAKWLGAPVLLVLDCWAMARSAAAVALGFRDFDPALRLGGLVFNRVGGQAHTRWLADAVQSAGLGLAVLGGLPKDESVVMRERHLGLHLPGDEGVPPGLIPALAILCARHLDLEALTKLAATAHTPALPPPNPAAVALPLGPAVRVSVAQDAAFCFYYQENLALLEEAGAELVYFSPLSDTCLPAGTSGVYLGGGYPERYASQLASNQSMRGALHAFAAAGGVVYAECGGLMYLSESLQPKGEAQAQPMVGVLPFQIAMVSLTMSYVEVETSAANPLFPPHVKARGHLHHHSKILEEALGEDGKGEEQGQERGWATGYTVRPQVPGAGEALEGYCIHNVLASYVHLHWGSAPELAAALITRCRAVGPEAAAGGGST